MVKDIGLEENARLKPSDVIPSSERQSEKGGRGRRERFSKQENRSLNIVTDGN